MIRKTRKEKKRLVVISIIIVSLLVLLVVSVYQNFLTVMQNKKQTTILEAKYEKLLDDQKNLSSEVTKMQDPEYVLRYAKEKFLYSSKGEIILRLD